MEATMMFRTRAVGLIADGAMLKSVITAMYPDAPACPTDEYRKATMPIHPVIKTRRSGLMAFLLLPREEYGPGREARQLLAANGGGFPSGARARAFATRRDGVLELPDPRYRIEPTKDTMNRLTSKPEPIDPSPAIRIVERMSPVTTGSIIPLLQQLQEAYGYLPRLIVLDVCERTGLPASRVFGVATFYEQFHLEPRGRHLVRCCRGTACHVRGGKTIIQALTRQLGVPAGETTRDGRFTFETVACLGTCFLAPVIMVDDDYYGQMTPARIKKILDRYQ